MSNFLDTNSPVTAFFGSGNTIYIVGFLMFIIFFAVAMAVKMRADSRYVVPHTGFLGKPLLAVMMTLVMVLGAGGAIYLNYANVSSPIAKADLNITAVISKEALVDNGSSFIYRFKAVPRIDDVIFGTDPNAVWNISWRIRKVDNDEIVFVQTKLNTKTIEDTSVDADLERGQYQVDLIIDYQGEQNKVVNISEIFSV